MCPKLPMETRLRIYYSHGLLHQVKSYSYKGTHSIWHLSIASEILEEVGSWDGEFLDLPPSKELWQPDKFTNKSFKIVTTEVREECMHYV